MKEYLLKQPKATCVLFSIACNRDEGRGGGGVALALEIRVGGGVKKPCHPSRGGGGCGFFLE